MRALQINELGGPEVMHLADITIPEPRPHQVLIQVEACGLNYSDILIREGQYIEATNVPYVLGREFCGVVEAVGEDVHQVNVGDRVLATTRGGGMAEYAIANADFLYPVPEGISPEEAVAMMVQGLTAIHCMDDCGQLQPGESILIHAAAGGVGTLAIQLAKQRTDKVFGTASNDEKCELIEELGGRGINYSHPDWVDQLIDMNDGQGVDVILESVGGEIYLRSFREALAEMGRLVVFGMSSREVVKLTNVEMINTSKTVVGYFLPTFSRRRPQRLLEASLELVQAVQSGTLKPIIGNTFALEDAVEAFNQMQNRESVGKVVIKP